EVQHALPLDGVGEQVAVEGRILRQQPVEFEHLRRRDDLVEAHLTGRNPRPVAQRQSVIGIRLAVPDALEDHADTLRGTRHRRRFRCRGWCRTRARHLRGRRAIRLAGYGPERCSPTGGGNGGGGLSSTEERRFKVLRAIVADYVSTKEPIGSKTLVDRHNLGVSSATVRNDMAVLEAEGYIAQPHTSSGRIPTDKGYRQFVDRISEVKPLSPAERRAIMQFLESGV